MTAQAHQLFNDLYYAPIDTTTQVTRFPPNDAPCICHDHEEGLYRDCTYPFCSAKPTEKCEACGREATRFNIGPDESKVVCDHCLFERWGLPPIKED